MASSSPSSSRGGVKWPFQLLRRDCVDTVEWHPKVTFLAVDAFSVVSLLILLGRLLTHRWSALQRQEEVGRCRRWAMVCGRRSAAEAAWVTISELFDSMVRG